MIVADSDEKTGSGNTKQLGSWGYSGGKLVDVVGDALPGMEKLLGLNPKRVEMAEPLKEFAELFSTLP